MTCLSRGFTLQVYNTRRVMLKIRVKTRPNHHILISEMINSHGVVIFHTTLKNNQMVDEISR